MATVTNPMKDREKAQAQLRETLAKSRFVVVVMGEGAMATLLPNSSVFTSVHLIMCGCKNEWDNCKTPYLAIDLSRMTDPDEWTIDECGDFFSIHWTHETGTINLYRLEGEVK